jgi:hypothetical protein
MLRHIFHLFREMKFCIWRLVVPGGVFWNGATKLKWKLYIVNHIPKYYALRSSSFRLHNHLAQLLLPTTVENLPAMIASLRGYKHVINGFITRPAILTELASLPWFNVVILCCENYWYNYWWEGHYWNQCLNSKSLVRTIELCLLTVVLVCGAWLLQSDKRNVNGRAGWYKIILRNVLSSNPDSSHRIYPITFFIISLISSRKFPG